MTLVTPRTSTFFQMSLRDSFSRLKVKVKYLRWGRRLPVPEEELPQELQALEVCSR